ncbi:hypothetical protein ACFLTA_02415 [Bacteroidota bacterium]
MDNLDTINKPCRYCQGLIPKHANTCYHCHNHQNKTTNFIIRFGAPAISILLIGLALAQTIFAFGQKAEAERAFAEAQIAKEQSERLKNEIDSTANVLRNITKMNFENTYLMDNTSLQTEVLNNQGRQKVEQNYRDLSYFIEPDSAKNKLYWDSLNKSLN